MTSSPDTFSSVEPKAQVSFPAAEPVPAELQGQTAAAAQTAQMALGVGIVGALLGVGGLVVGVWGLRTARTSSAGQTRSGGAVSQQLG
jgi:hypothetical protein